MILVTRLNGSKFYINAEMILTVEETPDTVITLVDHHRFIVRDRPEKIVERFIAYQREISVNPLMNSVNSTNDER